MKDVRSHAERGRRRRTRLGVTVWAGVAGPHRRRDRRRPPRGPGVCGDLGDDDWPGTIDHRPFATPADAQRAVRARTARTASDMVVNLRGGTYRLPAPLRMTGDDSGRGGRRVVHQAYGFGTPGQEKVTLSGGRSVTGWRPDPEREEVWRAGVGCRETAGCTSTADGRPGRASARVCRASCGPPPPAAPPPARSPVLAPPRGPGTDVPLRLRRGPLRCRGHVPGAGEADDDHHGADQLEAGPRPVRQGVPRRAVLRRERAGLPAPARQLLPRPLPARPPPSPLPAGTRPGRSPFTTVAP
jgi:hypothetical protein